MWKVRRLCENLGWVYIFCIVSFAQNVPVESVDANIAYTNLTDLGFDPNSTLTKDIGQPLPPESEFVFKLAVRTVPIQSMPLGHLSHHLLSLVDATWIQEDNSPITRPVVYRDADFPDILTRVEPTGNSDVMTPTALALGFNIIAQAVFYQEESHSMAYDWNYRGRRKGISQTYLSPRSEDSPGGIGSINSTRSVPFLGSRDVTNFDIISSNAGNGGGNSSNPATAHTRFTGISMPPSRYLILLINLFQRFWALRAQDPISDDGAQHPLILFRYPDEPYWLEYRHLAFDRPDGSAITWEDLTSRMLRMLQLPAYLNRWETMESEFYIDDKQIGILRFYRDASVPVG